MKAIIAHREGKLPTLKWEEVEAPDYGPAEVLVDIRASAVNRADLAQAAGNYPPPPGVTDILGLEMAGRIRAIGNAVTGWSAGDRVCALLAGGGYAEQVAVHQHMLMKLPDSWSFAEGAAIPEVWFTAYVNLFLEGKLAKGERVLIHAGGSGVGTAAVQLARWAGAEVFVTAGTEKKLAACRSLGASVAINYKEQDFLERVMAATDGEGVDVVLDPVGGSYLERNIGALRHLGRLVNIGLLGGPAGELNMGRVLGNRLRIIGSRLRNRPLEEKIAITREFTERSWPALLSGELRPVIDKVFPMPDAQAAHQYVRDDLNLGKVVLSLESG